MSAAGTSNKKWPTQNPNLCTLGILSWVLVIIWQFTKCLIEFRFLATGLRISLGLAAGSLHPYWIKNYFWECSLLRIPGDSEHQPLHNMSLELFIYKQDLIIESLLSYWSILTTALSILTTKCKHASSWMVSDEGHMQVQAAIFRFMRANFRQETLTHMNLFPDILTCMHKMYEDASPEYYWSWCFFFFHSAIWEPITVH